MEILVWGRKERPMAMMLWYTAIYLLTVACLNLSSIGRWGDWVRRKEKENADRNVR